MSDVQPVQLTAVVRDVLRALAARPGVKVSVRDLARASRRSPSAVRAALAQLGKAELVRHLLQASERDRPPHLVYWATQAGRDVAAGMSDTRQERAPRSA